MRRWFGQAGVGATVVLLAACSGDVENGDDDGVTHSTPTPTPDPVEKFLGEWTYISGSKTGYCTTDGSSNTYAMEGKSITLAAGTTSSLIEDVGCIDLQINLDSLGTTALAVEGQKCVIDNDSTIQITYYSAWSYEYNEDGTLSADVSTYTELDYSNGEPLGTCSHKWSGILAK